MMLTYMYMHTVCTSRKVTRTPLFHHSPPPPPLSLSPDEVGEEVEESTDESVGLASDYRTSHLQRLTHSSKHITACVNALCMHTFVSLVRCSYMYMYMHMKQFRKMSCFGCCCVVLYCVVLCCLVCCLIHVP